MAEMNIKQITDKLNEEFSGEGRRLVFWYDNAAEFKEDIDSLELENAKVYRLEQDNQFYTKYFLEKVDTETNYLLYAPFPRPDIRVNHLADTLRYSKEFFADRTSLICLDLGIREELKPMIQKYLKFFANKQRSQAFYNLDPECFVSADMIESGMMSIICKSPSTSFEDIVRSMLSTEGYEDNSYLQEFEKYDLTKAFWNHCESEFGYVDSEPSLEKFMMTLFVTYIRRYLQGQLPRGWQSFLSTKATNMVSFLDNTMNSAIYSERYDQFSAQMEKALDVTKELKKLDIDLYADCGAFKAVDEIILDWLTDHVMTEDLEARIDGKTIPEICQARKKLHFGRQYANEYSVLENAYNICLQGHYTPVTGAARIADKYIKTYCKIDRAYRYFYFYLDKMVNSTRFENLTGKIEDLYTNVYLSGLCSNFSHELEDDKCNTGLIKQINFYSEKVSSLREKTVIFISDAMRYEVGLSLYERLSSDEKATASLTAMQSVIPSFTQFGMAALLPHNEVEITSDAKVTCDNEACDSRIQREAILQRHIQRCKAVQFDEVKNMKQNELRAVFNGMDVVYVYHNQIDARGDKTASENEVFNACEEAIEELALFIRRLCTSANVYHFMVTADHGFIYRRSKLQASDKISGIPNASRRYAIGDTAIEKDGVVNLRFRDILGNDDTKYVSCPVGPDLFNAPGSGLNYIHGGCSPQEIIIPLVVAKLEKARVETAKAKISLINLNNKITNLTTQLDFIQNEPVSDTVKATTYHIYFEDEDAARITGDQIFVADLMNTDAQQRKKRLKFTFKNQAYPAGRKYYLVIREDRTDLEIDRQEFRIDIAFANDYGF